MAMFIFIIIINKQDVWICETIYLIILELILKPIMFHNKGLLFTNKMWSKLDLPSS